MRTVTLSAFVLLLGTALPATSDTTLRTVETEHYVLHTEASAVEADEQARVLEAAYQGFVEWFEAEPDVEGDGKLTIKMLADKTAWVAALRADGVQPPRTAGGYYWPGNRTVYLYRQPTAYYSRVLLVHEAAHQFHFLARTRNKSPASTWYAEGIAEYLSWHTWDGSRLRLAQRPWLTMKDYAAGARSQLHAPEFDLQRVTADGEWPGRAMTWALFSYLATGRDGKPLKGFETFCRKMDKGGSVAPLFRRGFRGGKRFEKAFSRWLDEVQQPWVQVFNQWEDRGDGRLRGHAGVVSFCRTKADLDELAADLVIPDAGAWRGGLLLQYGGNDDYLIGTVLPGGAWRVERRGGGTWHRMGAGRLETGAREPATGVYELRARRTDHGVEMRVGAQVLGTWPADPSPMGLVLDACDLTFAAVTWKPAGSEK